MADYQPHLISNLRTAKSIGLDPWLTPEDGFPVLQNARINKGVLEKRNGFSPYAIMKHDSTEQSDTAVMGIHTYLKRGKPTLLIMDTKRINRYDADDATTVDISGGSDLFTGDNADFFWFANWRGIGYMTNNKDQIHQYDGSSVSAVNLKISTDPKTNHINCCRMIFIKDDRMIIFDTVELGTWYPQRARYSPVLSTDFAAAGSGYVDAPTQARIVTGGFVGKKIVIFFSDNTLWEFSNTGDTTDPYKWNRITDTEGSRTPYVCIPFRDGLVTIGNTNILHYDGFKLTDLDVPQVRDILSDFSNAKIRLCHGLNTKESRHLLFTYTNNGDSLPNRILDYNGNENNWSVHKSKQSFFPHCLGSFTGQQIPSWIEVDLIHHGDTDAEVSDMDIDSRDIFGSPHPFTLIGCRNSQVYKWDDGSYDGTDDNSGKIALDIQSGRWNPYIKQGRKASLSKIMFLVDSDSTASVLATLFKNSGVIGSDTAYKSQTLTFTGVTNKAKTWITLHVGGEVANFHQLRLSHTDKANRPRIHAVMPFFKQAGRLDL